MRIPGLITTGTATIVAGVATMTLGLIVALAVAPVGSAYGPPAAAAQAATPVTITPATGTDVTAPSGTLSGPCDAVAADGSTSDGFAAFLSGPGVFAPNPGAGQPFGVAVQFGTGGSFSKTQPFTFPFRASIIDIAAEQGQSGVLPGDYVLTVNCTDSFTEQVFQEFRGGLTFTTPTSYTASDAPPPTTTPSATPTASSSPSPPSSSSPPSPTPTPTPASPTPTPTPTPTLSLSPTPTAIASGGTSGTGTGTGTGSGTGSGTGTSARGGLALTGSPVEAMIATGLGLSVLGSGLMLAARRRRAG